MAFSNLASLGGKENVDFHPANLDSGGLAGSRPGRWIKGSWFFKKMNLWRQDKGQKACAAAFLEAIEKGSQALIPVDEIFEVARVSIEVAQMLREQ